MSTGFIPSQESKLLLRMLPHGEMHFTGRKGIAQCGVTILLLDLHAIVGNQSIEFDIRQIQ